MEGGHKEECRAATSTTDRARLSATRVHQQQQGRFTMPNDDDSDDDKLSPSEERTVMKAWTDSMPRHMMMMDRNKTANEIMSKLNVTPDFVKGIRVGNWHSLMMRMQQNSETNKVQNALPLEAGNYIEVMDGNSIRFGTFGKRGIIKEYFRNQSKWGIEFDDGKEGLGLVHKHNLKRLASSYREFQSDITTPN